MADRNAARNVVFKRGRAEEWTAERIAKLSKLEIQQLRDNATRLGEPAVTALCTEALKPSRLKANLKPAPGSLKAAAGSIKAAAGSLKAAAAK